MIFQGIRIDDNLRCCSADQTFNESIQNYEFRSAFRQPEVVHMPDEGNACPLRSERAVNSRSDCVGMNEVDIILFAEPYDFVDAFEDCRKKGYRFSYCWKGKINLLYAGCLNGLHEQTGFASKYRLPGSLVQVTDQLLKTNFGTTDCLRMIQEKNSFHKQIIGPSRRKRGAAPKRQANRLQALFPQLVSIQPVNPFDNRTTD